MNFWWRYPLWKARVFMTEIATDRTKVEMAHVLRIGPLAFALIWQERRAASPLEPGATETDNA